MALSFWLVSQCVGQDKDFDNLMIFPLNPVFSEGVPYLSGLYLNMLDNPGSKDFDNLMMEAWIKRDLSAETH